MSFTSSDLAAIDAAIASGELTVESNGRRVTYRSMADLTKARDLIVGQLAAQAGTSGTTRRGAFSVRFTTARGD